jgi:hypothetical protein
MKLIVLFSLIMITRQCSYDVMKADIYIFTTSRQNHAQIVTKNNPFTRFNEYLLFVRSGFTFHCRPYGQSYLQHFVLTPCVTPSH